MEIKDNKITGPISVDLGDGKGKDEFIVVDSSEKQEFSTGSRRDKQTGKGRFDLIPTLALRRLALVYEKGADKYGENNWRLGQPSLQYFNSGIRHILAWREGEKTEDHLAQAAFNIFAALWTENEIKEGRLPKELDSFNNCV